MIRQNTFYRNRRTVSANVKLDTLIKMLKTLGDDVDFSVSPNGSVTITINDFNRELNNEQGIADLYRWLHLNCVDYNRNIYTIFRFEFSFITFGYASFNIQKRGVSNAV